jgi:hypothetical protein
MLSRLPAVGQHFASSVAVSRLTTSRTSANPAILASFAIGVPHQDRNNHYGFEQSPNELVRALDGHTIAAAGETWEIAVSGIHAVGPHRWIQISLDGPTSEHLVLRIPGRAGSPEAINAIRAWIETPSRTERILRVE